MIIISDTSPLHLLIQVGQIQVLPALFTNVVIPTEVTAELSHPNTPLPVQTFIAAPPPWLSIQQPRTLLPLSALHPEETAAISLAIELQALLLIDERDGRAEARSRGVRIIGAIGALEQAANAGLIVDLATSSASSPTTRPSAFAPCRMLSSPGPSASGPSARTTSA